VETLSRGRVRVVVGGRGDSIVRKGGVEGEEV